MELTELEIGHLRSGFERERDPVAGGDGRVRRVGERRARPTRREHDRRCFENPLGFGDEVEREHTRRPSLR